MIQHRGLQPAEAEIQRIPFHLRRAKLHRRRRAIRSRCQRVQNGPAGIAQAQQFRYFVVRFARRIVPRLSHLPVTQRHTRILYTGILRFHFIQNGVSPRNDQADGRQICRAPRFVRLQKNRMNVPFQVIHRHQRLPQRLRQRFSIRNSHQQRAHQPRSLRHANRIHI